MGGKVYIVFREVKEKVSIPLALERLGIIDQFTERRGAWTGACPLKDHKHGPEPNKRQFSADDRKGLWMWQCFSPGDHPKNRRNEDGKVGGDVIELVKGVTELDDEHVRFWFASNCSDVLQTTKPKASKTAAKQEAPKRAGEGTAKQSAGIKPLDFYLNVDSKAAGDYLGQRGISMATAKRYGVGMYAKPGRMFSGYMVAPCYRYPKGKPDENPVGYVGRWPMKDMDEEHPRYKVGFECSNAVYGLAEALEGSGSSDSLIVVEGFLKTLWLVDRGYTNAVSTFTASVSDVQAELLIKTGRPIVLAFDGNEPGLAGMRSAAGKLIKRAYVRIVALPDDKEPDQLDSSMLEEFFGFAKP